MKKLVAWVVVLSGCAAPDREPFPSLPEVAVPEASSAGTPSLSVRELSLEQAWARAEKAHPELSAARARIDGARGRSHQAGLYPNPELIARIEVAPIRGGTADEAEYVGGLGQRLPVGGRLSAAVRVEELERDRLLKELEVRRLEVRTRVHAAFGAALYMEESVRLHDGTFRMAEGGVEVTKARQAAGDALPEDVARGELESLKARLERDRAASVREEALLALAAALGEPGLRIESVSGLLESALAIPALESLLAALGGSPWVGSAEAGVAVERAREELARAERIPDVNLEVLYRRQEATRTDAFDAGVSVAIPLFDRNQGRLREARAEVAAAEARARLTRNELERQLREAHLRLSRAMAQARFLRDEIRPRAETVLRGAEARYAGGDLSLADLLPIRRDQVQGRLAHLDSLRAVLDAWAAFRPFVSGE